MTTIHNQLARCPRMLVWAIALIIVLFACINTPAHAQEKTPEPSRMTFTYVDDHITMARVGDRNTPYHNQTDVLAHEERYRFTIIPTTHGGLSDGLDDVWFVISAWDSGNKERQLVLTEPMTLTGTNANVFVQTDDLLGLAPGDYDRLRFLFYWPDKGDGYINEAAMFDFDLVYPNGSAETTRPEYRRWLLDKSEAAMLDLFMFLEFSEGRERDGIKSDFAEGEVEWVNAATKVVVTRPNKKQAKVKVDFRGDPRAAIHFVSVVNEKDRNDTCEFSRTQADGMSQDGQVDRNGNPYLAFKGMCEVKAKGIYIVRVISLPYQNAIYNGTRSKVKGIEIDDRMPWERRVDDVGRDPDEKG